MQSVVATLAVSVSVGVHAADMTRLLRSLGALDESTVWVPTRLVLVLGGSSLAMSMQTSDVTSLLSSLRSLLEGAIGVASRAILQRVSIRRSVS